MFKQKITILDQDACLIECYPGMEGEFDPLAEIESFALQQESIRIFGKELAQPRLSRFYGDPNISYTYSGKQFEALPWNRFLSELKDRMEERFKSPFNSALVNLYRNGADSMGIHADNEKELGPFPTIISVSYGASRRMIFRNNNSREKIEIALDHGDVLIMSGATQDLWKHEIPKQRLVAEARMNITFRKILGTD